MGDSREERGAVSVEASGGEDPCRRVPISVRYEVNPLCTGNEELEERIGEEQQSVQGGRKIIEESEFRHI